MPLCKRLLREHKTEGPEESDASDTGRTTRSFEFYLPDAEELPNILSQLSRQRCLYIVDQRNPDRPILMVQPNRKFER